MRLGMRRDKNNPGYILLSLAALGLVLYGAVSVRENPALGLTSFGLAVAIVVIIVVIDRIDRQRAP